MGGFFMVYRLIVVLVLGGMIGTYVQAADLEGTMVKLPTFGASVGANANLMGVEQQLIMQAAATGDIAAMRTLPDGIDVDIVDENRDTPLTIAIKNKKSEVMQFLIGKGASVNRHSEYGRTPLMIAARFGTEEAVLKLLEAGAFNGVNDKDEFDDCTALMEAAESGYGKAVAALLKSGARQNDKDKMGSTALMIAAKCGHKEVVEELLAVGVEVDMGDLYKETALIKAIKSGKNEIVSLLLTARADVNVEGCGYKALYHAASAANKYEIGALQALLNAGVRVDVKGRDGSTALMIAAERGNEAAVKALLGGVGATKEYIDMHREKNGGTALMEAIRSGNWKCIKALLDAGADISKPNKDGYTPLALACIHRNYFLGSDKWYLFRYLLKKAVDFTWSDENDRTFLMYAAQSGSVETVQALLEVGVDVNLQDSEGRTALMFAVDATSKHYKEEAKETQEAREIVEKLLKASAKIDEQDKHGLTALMLAALKSNYEVVNLLLLFGADRTLQNDEGKTAEQLSYERFPFSGSYFLLKRGDPYRFSLYCGENHKNKQWKVQISQEDQVFFNHMIDCCNNGAVEKATSAYRKKLLYSEYLYGDFTYTNPSGFVCSKSGRLEIAAKGKSIVIESEEGDSAIAVEALAARLEVEGESQARWTRVGSGFLGLGAVVGALSYLAQKFFGGSGDSPVGGNSLAETNSQVDSDAHAAPVLVEAQAQVLAQDKVADKISGIASNKELSASDLDEVLGQAQEALVEVGGELYQSKNSEAVEKALVQEGSSAAGFISDGTLSTVKKTALGSVLTAGMLKLFHYCYSQYKKNSGLRGVKGKVQMWAEKALYYAQQYKKLIMATTGATAGGLAVVGFYLLQNR